MLTSSKLWALAALLLGVVLFAALFKFTRESKPAPISHVNIEHLVNHTAYAEKIYRAAVRDRKDRMNKMYGGDPNSVIPWDGHHANYLWDLFPPSYNCPYRERIGRFSEGGKVLCNPSQLHNSTIFSFGVRTDVSFENSILDMVSGCTIYAFDPSVNALPDGHSRASNAGNTSTMQFYKIGLKGKQPGNEAPGDWSLMSLESLMSKFGVKKIDLLKIDCEGCEWGAFDDMRASKVLKHIDQLSIELHFPQHSSNSAGRDSGVREVFKLFEACEAAGLFAFSWEVNHNPSGYFNQKPWAIEYTFVRSQSSFMNKSPTIA